MSGRIVVVSGVVMSVVSPNAGTTIRFVQVALSIEIDPVPHDCTKLP